MFETNLRATTPGEQETRATCPGGEQTRAKKQLCGPFITGRFNTDDLSQNLGFGGAPFLGSGYGSGSGDVGPEIQVRESRIR